MSERLTDEQVQWFNDTWGGSPESNMVGKLATEALERGRERDNLNERLAEVVAERDLFWDERAELAALNEASDGE